MDGSMRMNGALVRSKARQSIALRNLRGSVAGGISNLRGGRHDEVDDLVVKVLKAIDDEADAQAEEEALNLEKLSMRGNVPSSRMSELQLQKRTELRVSQFWTFFLAIPIIFTHGVATRMQFMYGGLYGRDGLNLNNALAILAVGFTAMGRATAPPLLSRFFGNPYLFMFLNSATLIGCSMMFLIPYVGGIENFNEVGNLEGDEPGSAKTVSFFYFSMYIQGLAEVLSGWDMLMKFEMRKWEPEKQQLAFRVSFVSIALGSATAFAASAWLFEHFGLMGCAYLGVSSGAFNVVFPGIYLYCRWEKFSIWRAGGNKKRSVASRKSQPLMRIIHLDDDGREDTSEEMRKSTMKLKLKTSSVNSSTRSAISSTSALNKNEPRVVSEYVPPRNYFEFQKQLQHQTAERLVNNFKSLKERTRGFMKEQLANLQNDDILAAFDPNLLLTHSAHIHWPKGFHKQIFVMRWFCILSLALGSMMISSQFAVYVLYLVDVWEVPVVFAGTSMALGEISGMLTLLLSIYLEKRQAAKASSEEEGDNKRASTYTSEEEKEKLSTGGTWRNLLTHPTLVFQVPSMFVVTCIAAVIPLGLLGTLKPPQSDELDLGAEEEPDLENFSWSAQLIIALSSGVAVGIVNCVMHATTIEMAAMLLPEDLFGSAVAWGYSFRRITNLMVCLMATGLYSLSEHLVYQVIATVYALSVPGSIYVLAFYIKCMPWQKREVVFETTLEGELADLDQNGADFSLRLGGLALPAFDEEEDDESDGDSIMLKNANGQSIQFDDSEAENLESDMFEKLIEKRLTHLYGDDGIDEKIEEKESADVEDGSALAESSPEEES